MYVIEVIDGGMFTTVQDLGRYGYQRYGVPASGAMDPFALRVANLLVGNQEDDAGLEVSMVGAKMRFLAETVLAITGADLSPLLDGLPFPMWEALVVPMGSELSFVGVRDGVRSYLAIAGGIDVPAVLGSRSTYTPSRLGGFQGRALAASDRISTSWQWTPDRLEGRRLSPDHIPRYGHTHTLRVIMGPQDDAFTEEGIETFLSSTYTVTSMSDRVGCRLEGAAVHGTGSAGIISDGSPLGSVQITGDGLPIILAVDRGTTGGYVKIATVISGDFWSLAQAAPGDAITFQRVGVGEAHEVLEEQRKVLEQVRNGPAIVFARPAYTVSLTSGDYSSTMGLKEVEPKPDGDEVAERTLTVSVDDDGQEFEVEVAINSGEKQEQPP